MTAQSTDATLPQAYVSAILDDSCDAAVEGGECFYCTGPETD